MLICVGDTLKYTTDGYDYCLTVERVLPDYVVVRHAPPHEEVRFRFYLRPVANSLGTMHSLIAKIRQGVYEFSGNVLSDPSWEV